MDLDPELTRVIARAIVRLVIEFPIAIILVKMWAWATFPWAKLPPVSWPQSTAIALLLMFVR